MSAIVSGPSRISTVTGKRPRALRRPRTTAALPLYLGLALRPSMTTLLPTANAAVQGGRDVPLQHLLDGLGVYLIENGGDGL